MSRRGLAATLADPDKLEAELEFRCGLRAIGPTPAALRPNPNRGVVPVGFLQELVAAMDDLADQADEQTRLLGWSVRSRGQPRADAPNTTAVTVITVGFSLWGDMGSPDVGAVAVAEALDLPAAYVARWALRYERLHSRRLQRVNPALHAAYMVALGVEREMLLTGAAGIRLHPGNETAPSIERLLLEPNLT